MSNTKRLILILTGSLLFILCYFCLPASVFAEASARAAIGTVAWMAFWWITGPVDFAVTGFLPIALNAVFQMTDSRLKSQVVFWFLLCAFLAAVAMPIVISIIQGIDKNPIPYIYIASIGVSLSYMLPTSIRAIPVGYGLEPKYMLKKGVPIRLL